MIGLAGILLVASQLLRAAPRDVDVELKLGPDHDRFVELRVAYVQQAEEIHGVAFKFPNGAPERVRHTVQLPAGEFEVHTELRTSSGPILANIGRLQAPSEGRVVIQVPTDQP